MGFAVASYSSGFIRLVQLGDGEMTCPVWNSYIGTTEMCYDFSTVSIFYEEVMEAYVNPQELITSISFINETIFIYHPDTVIIEVDSIGSLDSSWIDDETLIGEGAIGVTVQFFNISNPEYVWESDEGAGDWINITPSLVEVVGNIYTYQFVITYGLAYIGIELSGITNNYFDPLYVETNGAYQGPNHEYPIVDIRLSTTDEFTGTPIESIVMTLTAVGN